jgi:hypothetical protein
MLIIAELLNEWMRLLCVVRSLNGALGEGTYGGAVLVRSSSGNSGIHANLANHCSFTNSSAELTVGDLLTVNLRLIMVWFASECDVPRVHDVLCHQNASLWIWAATVVQCLCAAAAGAAAYTILVAASQTTAQSSRYRLIMSVSGPLGFSCVVKMMCPCYLGEQ